LLGDLGKPLVKNHDAVPFGALLALAGHPVAPALRGGDRQIGDAHAVLGRADLRVAPEVADQDHFVNATCHGITARSGSSEARILTDAPSVPTLFFPWIPTSLPFTIRSATRSAARRRVRSLLPRPRIWYCSTPIRAR